MDEESERKVISKRLYTIPHKCVELFQSSCLGTTSCELKAYFSFGEFFKKKISVYLVEIFCLFFFTKFCSSSLQYNAQRMFQVVCGTKFFTGLKIMIAPFITWRQRISVCTLLAVPCVWCFTIVHGEVLRE